MDIKIKCDRDFELALDNMRHKYGEDFEFLNGLHESQIDTTEFINGFVDKQNVADATIDSNANVTNKDVRALLNEKGKSEEKVISFNKIFYELKKKYGLETARKWLEAEWNGTFYMHDASSSSCLPYCFAYSLDRLAQEGLFFLKNYNPEPAKHLTTFLDHVIEFISFFSNRSSGACGLPNLLIWTYFFWKRDIKNGYCIRDPEYYLKQCFQKLIYRLNQPFLRITQAAFVNMSIFDRPYLESLFGGLEYPDGSFAIDNIDNIIEHQKIFMEVVSEIRSVNLFTYPILTYSLLKRENISNEEANEMIKSKNYNVFVDKEFAKWCSDHNVTWNDSNFFMSTDVGTLSNCFSYDQFALLKINGEITCKEFQSIYYQLQDVNVEALYCGEWKKAKFLHLDPSTLYRIKTYNGKELVATDNHLHPTDRGLRTTLQLYKGMNITKQMIISKLRDTFDINNNVSNNDLGYIIDYYLLNEDSEFSQDNDRLCSMNLQVDQIQAFKRYIEANFKIEHIDSTNEMQTIQYKEVYKLKNNIDIHAPITNNNLSKELGYIIGCYLRNGTTKYSNDIGRVISLNIHNDKIEEIHKFIKEYFNIENINSSGEFNTIIENSIEFNDFITKWTYFIGISTGKELIMQCIDESLEFREGIIDGLKNNDKIIILKSKRLCNEISSVITSLGLVCRIVTEKCNDSDCDENNESYNIKIYNNKPLWDRIISVEPVELKQDPKLVYCVQMEDVINHYFTLPNGIITSNCCRLLSDTKKLDAFINSIGGTALSIGSIKVNTINLMRVALESPKKDIFLNIKEKYSTFLTNLREKTILCCQVLDIVRHIIKRNVEKGLLPNYCEGGVEMDKQYCTIGILGTYEVMKHYGLIKFDEFGNAFYTDEAIELANEIFNMLNNIKDNFTNEYSMNIESVPAERAAVILCQKDNKLFETDKNTFIYSNQWIPLSQKCTIQEKLRVSSILDAKCSGGAIAHINLEHNFPNNETAWDMLNKIALLNVIYFAFNTRINECKHHHGFIGTDHCPVCGENIFDQYSRIVGYLVPTRSYSSDRFKEFSTRRWFDYASELKDL